MLKEELLRKVFINKANNQISLTLPKKKLFPNKKPPKFIKIKIKELIY